MKNVLPFTGLSYFKEKGSVGRQGGREGRRSLLPKSLALWDIQKKKSNRSIKRVVRIYFLNELKESGQPSSINP